MLNSVSGALLERRRESDARGPWRLGRLEIAAEDDGGGVGASEREERGHLAGAEGGARGLDGIFRIAGVPEDRHGVGDGVALHVTPNVRSGAGRWRERAVEYLDAREDRRERVAGSETEVDERTRIFHVDEPHAELARIGGALVRQAGEGQTHVKRARRNERPEASGGEHRQFRQVRVIAILRTVS